MSGVAALTGASDLTGIGRKEGVLGQAGGFINSSLESLESGMELVALLVVSSLLRTAGGGPMDPSLDDLLLGVLDAADSGLLQWTLDKDSSFNPPNLVEMETSLEDDFLGGAKMDESPVTVFLGLRNLRIVKLSVPFPE